MTEDGLGLSICWSVRRSVLDIAGSMLGKLELAEERCSILSAALHSQDTASKLAKAARMLVL